MLTVCCRHLAWKYIERSDQVYFSTRARKKMGVAVFPRFCTSMTADFSNGMHHQDRISAGLHVERKGNVRLQTGTAAEEIAERTADLRMRGTVKSDRQEDAAPRLCGCWPVVALEPCQKNSIA